MAAIFEFSDKEKIATFTVSGILTRQELEQVQMQCESKIKQVGTISCLVLATDFAGWNKEMGWEDMLFAERNDPFISKMAIVGDSKWKELVYAFTVKGLRPVNIKYFSQGQENEARYWLVQPS